MFLGTTAEENSNLRHSREINGLTSRDPQVARTPSTGALAWSAAFWLAAGIGSGVAAAGAVPLSVGLPLSVGSAAAAVAIASRRSTKPHGIEAGEPAPRNEAALTSAALGRAMADLDNPDAALQKMLRLVARAVGSRTALLLTLTGGGTSLTLDHIIVDGAIPAEPGTTSMNVADGGPLRMALLAGVPVAANGSTDDPGAWKGFADAHGLASAAVVPLAVTNSQIGLLVVAIQGAAVSKAHLARLHGIMPAASASIGAMLRLRHVAETTARTAQKAGFRSDYAMVVGHELRTPLTTILGVLKTLARPEMAPDNADARDLLEMAGAQGDRLRRLVEDMLAISQVDNGGIPVHPELVSLPDVANRAIDAVPGAEDVTTVWIQDSLPPVVLDPEHTRRVLVNLLANSIKYGEGSPIEVGARVDRNDLVLTVADHGPGLPPDTAARAFDAFTQLNRTEVDAYGGVGLGLSISQGVVEAMGGTIRHESTAGGGATFVVRLPFKPHPGPRTGYF